MGADVQDYGIGPDRAIGTLGIVLYIGHGAQGLHLPSPRLSRDDVIRLWLWRHGRAALPASIQDWWLSLGPRDHQEIRAMIADLPALMWWALWWTAPGNPDTAG